MPHPKPRGIGRHCSAFARRMAELTCSFPEAHAGRGYWHHHLPIAQNFIDNPRTPQGARRQCVQLLLDAASRLTALRPASIAAPMVVAVSTPRVFDSQLIVFYSSDYFASFFHRDAPDQQWTQLPTSRSLAREWRLSVPPGFCERGYHEHIHDDSYQHDGEIRFFGELS